MKASILAIGTELTTGQIINGNAATLSKKLNDLGINVTAHLTVADNHQNILNALNILENKLLDASVAPSEENLQISSPNDLLFITGGLGPTSDDFTRDVIAKWLDLPMEFNEASWLQIQERLSTRGFHVREIQKQQCYFPENSEILLNSEGTANAFKLRAKNKIIYVLPGPPREIEAIWKDHILSELSEKTKGLSKIVTKSWDTLGLGESDVAFLVEEALNNQNSQLIRGYRVHQPYVEVKLSFISNDADKWAPWLKKVDTALESITVSRDFVDIAKLCSEKLKNLDFTFYDYVSDGFLHARIAPFFKDIKNWSFKQTHFGSHDTPSADFFESEDNFLALLPFETDKCIVIYSLHGGFYQSTIKAPMKSALMIERRKQYFAEMALVELSRASSIK